MDTYIGYDDKLEKLLNLSIGKVRELLAYADGDESLDDWLDDVVPALLDDDWDDEEEDEWDEDYQEEEDTDDEDWDDEDEDYEVEDDGEGYLEDGEAELANPEEEQLAQDIAGDIAWGKYTLSDIPTGIYSQEVMNRIRYLI